MANPRTERLNKVVARVLNVSRRKADEIIAAGQIKVNGKAPAMGQQIDVSQDVLKYKGEELITRPVRASQYQYIMFYKPKGVMTTKSDPQGRQTIYDVLPKQYHKLKPAGRLDRNTTGLLVLSDDGTFLNRLVHPSYKLSKTYLMRLETPIATKALKVLEQGVLLEPENKVAYLKIQGVSEDRLELEVTTQTGYNRQIRRMLSAVGSEVKDLKRVAIGPIVLKGLRPGHCRPLSKTELKSLQG